MEPEIFDLFDALRLIGGICLFLFGMNVMGDSLERRAGSGLQSLLGKLTSNKFAGFLTGMLVTAIIQASGATTVMVVGFVNSGIMSLTQAINVIMGANVGTTVTAWILSLAGLEGGNMFTDLLKPMSWTPILALIGIGYTMFGKDSKKKDTGGILLGFAVLMFGMDTMTQTAQKLETLSWFQNMFVAFQNPILALIAGAVLTAALQSSSASVGILQALSATGQVSLGAAIPIIMGQNIGTCLTAMMSSIGANKNARRAALVHLCFNVVGSIVWLTVFAIVQAAFAPAIFAEPANGVNIAVCHSLFNVACTALLLPMSKLLEKLACLFIPDDKQPETVTELDERLLATPSMALDRCRNLTIDMADCARLAVAQGMDCLDKLEAEKQEHIMALEDKTDHYEDVLGTYLVKLSSSQLSDNDSAYAAMLLKAIGDFERIGDHAASILHAAEELATKEMRFSEQASQEMSVLREAVQEIIGLAVKAFSEEDVEAAARVEPLEQIIDRIKEQLRRRHIERLQQGKCTIEVGFIWSDLLTDLGRISDHCSNIAGGVIDLKQHNMNIHEALRTMKSESEEYKNLYKSYKKLYLERV